MNQELARKLPANVTRPDPRVRRVGHIIATTKSQALAELGRRQVRGGIESAWPVRLITEGPHAGRYAIRVTLLPERPDPRWAVVLRNVGFALLGLAAFLGALAWLLSAMTGAALVTVCVAAVAVLGFRVWLKHGRRRGTLIEFHGVARVR